MSLSMRWTMPGRATPPMPESEPPQWWSSALTSVPSKLPAAGWTTRPAGLSTTSRCSSSKTMVSGMSCGSLCAGRRLGHLDAEALVAFDLGRRVADRTAACADGAASDQRLQALARKVGNGRGEGAVKAPAGMSGLQAHVDRLMTPHLPPEYGFQGATVQWRGRSIALGAEIARPIDRLANVVVERSVPRLLLGEEQDDHVIRRIDPEQGRPRPVPPEFADRPAVFGRHPSAGRCGRRNRTRTRRCPWLGARRAR